MEDTIEPAECLKIDVSSDISSIELLSHNEKHIDRIVVSTDMSYVVTYSEGDNSILGRPVDIEKDGPQKPDVKFLIDKLYKISSFVLHKKVLLIYYEDEDRENKAYYRLVDLNDGKGRFLELNRPEMDPVGENSIGFLPNGDLILVSLKEYKVYLYSFLRKSLNTLNSKASTWKYSQVYDIEISRRLKQDVQHNDEYINCFVYQTTVDQVTDKTADKIAIKTKLFISTTTRFHKYDSITTIVQWDLPNGTPSFDMQYNLSDSYRTIDLDKSLSNIVINKNQTLLALNIKK